MTETNGITVKQMQGLLAKHGKHERDNGRVKVYAVPCSACGRRIFSDSIVDDAGAMNVGCSITKRGSAVFWHDKCQGSVWGSKIHWQDPE